MRRAWVLGLIAATGRAVAAVAFMPAEKFKNFNMARAKADIDLIYKEVQK